MSDEPVGDEQVREDAVSAILAMVPPTLGGRDQALVNLRSMPTGALVTMRDNLQGALERIAEATPGLEPTSAEAIETRARGRGSLGRGLGKLRMAQASIRASRLGAVKEGPAD